jgi:protein-disulfide isomerase
MAHETGNGILTLPVGPRDHRWGPDDAPVTLVEYGDYECPHCGKAYPIVKDIKLRLGDQLRFVYRHFPLIQVHPHAEHAAEAAEAAASQGKFWEMHDYLFEHQQALDDAHLIQYAAALGLDTRRFERELREHAHMKRVREDMLSGVESGVEGTPTFFINDIRYDGSYDRETLLAAIELAMLV